MMNKAEIKQFSSLAEEVGKRKILNRLANGMFPYAPISVEAKNDLDKAIKARNEYAMRLAGDSRE